MCPLLQDRINPNSLTYLSRKTTPSMQAPNRTTELISAALNEGETPKVENGPLQLLLNQPGKAATSAWPFQHSPPGVPSPAAQDTDSRGGGNSQDGARGNGLLSIPQVARAVRAGHDPCEQRSSSDRSQTTGEQREREKRTDLGGKGPGPSPGC